jgi:glycine/D-amino acid oxidase-like deaminating enzyme
VDAVVVGGGVIGSASALALARRGARVTLVERGELAAGASGRNHGLLFTPTDPVLVPVARATTALYQEVAAGAPVPIRLDRAPIGVLLAAGEDEAEREAGAAEAEAAAACGVAVDRLDGPGVRHAEPAVSEDVVEGWLLDDGRRLDPAALTVSMALLAREAGAEVRRHQAARALLTEGDRVRGIATDEGLIPADAVVVAAGPWSGPLLRDAGVRLPTVGARGWLVHMEGGPGAPSRIVERAGWHPLPDQEAVAPSLASDLGAGGAGPNVGSLIHPAVDGSVLAGGSRQVTAEPEDPSVPALIARRAIELLPGLADHPVLASWSGIRPMSPDGRPMVGEVREGLVVATGHGSQGVILGGGTGLLVASLVLGDEPPFDAVPFAPDRFA